MNRPLVVRYAQALGSSVLLLLVPVVARSLISSSGPGAFAAVNYAFKLSELPLGMLITVFPIVLLPRLSALFGEGKEAEAASLARWGIWMTWILSLPLALAGGWFRRPIIALLFGHGRMTEGTLGFVGDLTAWTMAALPAQGLAVLLFAVLSAKKDTRFIFRASVVGFLAFLPAAWAARVLLGPAGLMAAVVVLHWGIALSYGWALSRRHGMALLCDGLRRDLLLSALVVAAGFLPVALVPVRSFGAATGAGLAAAGSATALLALLILPRTRAALKALP